MAHLKYPRPSSVAQSGRDVVDHLPEAPFELPPLTAFVCEQRGPALDPRRGASPPALDPHLIDLLRRMARAAARTDHRDECRSKNQMR